MFFKLLALFTIVPLVELALLIYLSTLIDFWPTIGLVVATAVLGAVLGKLEGGRAWANIQRDLSEAQIPADSLLDGLAVLIAGVFLITPGVLTDVAAIVLLVPPLRKPLRVIAKKYFQKKMAADTMAFMTGGSAGADPFGPFGAGMGEQFDSPFAGAARQGDEIIDVTPDENNEDSTEPPSEASLRQTS